MHKTGMHRTDAHRHGHAQASAGDCWAGGAREQAENGGTQAPRTDDEHVRAARRHAGLLRK